MTDKNTIAPKEIRQLGPHSFAAGEEVTREEIDAFMAERGIRLT
jgi:hypothetical protein